MDLCKWRSWHQETDGALGHDPSLSEFWNLMHRQIAQYSVGRSEFCVGHELSAGHLQGPGGRMAPGLRPGGRHRG